DPDEREGGETEEPRELLPEDLGATLLGRDGRLAGRALGLCDVGRAGRALLPDGRRDGAGRTPCVGRTPWFAGLRTVPLRIPSVRVPRVAPGLTASLVVAPRVVDDGLIAERSVLLVATVRVEIRPLASRVMAVLEDPATRLERPVRTSILDRDAERMPRVRLSTIMAPG